MVSILNLISLSTHSQSMASLTSSVAPLSHRHICTLRQVVLFPPQNIEQHETLRGGNEEPSQRRQQALALTREWRDPLQIELGGRKGRTNIFQRICWAHWLKILLRNLGTPSVRMIDDSRTQSNHDKSCKIKRLYSYPTQATIVTRSIAAVLVRYLP